MLHGAWLFWMRKSRGTGIVDSSWVTFSVIGPSKFLTWPIKLMLWLAVAGIGASNIMSALISLKYRSSICLNSDERENPTFHRCQGKRKWALFYSALARGSDWLILSYNEVSRKPSTVILIVYTPLNCVELENVCGVVWACNWSYKVFHANLICPNGLWKRSKLNQIETRRKHTPVFIPCCIPSRLSLSSMTWGLMEPMDWLNIGR